MAFATSFVELWNSQKPVPGKRVSRVGSDRIMSATIHCHAMRCPRSCLPSSQSGVG